MATFAAINHKAIHQGGKYKNSKEQLIQKGFTSYEGFSGILGSNIDMNEVINQSTANTSARANILNNNIAQYGTDYNSLHNRTNRYINESIIDLNVEKNYNMFINRSKGPADIKETNQKLCVTRASISNLSPANGFDTAYPQNFINYTDANNACKLWAADSGKTTYAVTKDAIGNYQCYIGNGLASSITQNVKPATLYKILQGDTTSTKGGLFANGQIGVWNGNSGSSTSGQINVNDMTQANLLKKYNSTDYSTGPKGVLEVVNGGWWGVPGQSGGWGANFFPNDSNAWWISNRNYGLNGTMGYFYYVYDSPTAKNIGLYWVVDDAGELKVNGENIKGVNNRDNVNLKAGKNVFEFKLINTGGPGAFVFYAYDQNNNNVLFRSGPGWGYMMTPISDYKLVTNVGIEQANPTSIKTVNSVPAGYEKCDAVNGGGILRASIMASFGRNCSSVSNPQLNVRYIRVTPNDKGECIQIAQIVVNAIVNGSVVNVATSGTATGSPTWMNGTAPRTAIDGTLTPRSYPNIYHSVCSKGTFWQLDLGMDYPVTEIIYYNRQDCCSLRANGMKIQLTGNDGTVYQPITLTGALKQVFNISSKGVTVLSPSNVGRYEYTKPEAEAVCSARGQRLCTKAELNNSDFCSCGWTSDGTTPGYPMANGDQTGKNWCGGYNGGQVWRDCGATNWAIPDDVPNDGKRRASAHCCK